MEERRLPPLHLHRNSSRIGRQSSSRQHIYGSVDTPKNNAPTYIGTPRKYYYDSPREKKSSRHNRLNTVAYDQDLQDVKKEVGDLRKNIELKLKLNEQRFLGKIERLSSLFARRDSSTRNQSIKYFPAHVPQITVMPPPLPPPCIYVPQIVPCNSNAGFHHRYRNERRRKPKLSTEYSSGESESSQSQPEFHLKKTKNTSKLKPGERKDKSVEKQGPSSRFSKNRPELSFKKKKAESVRRKWRVYIWHVIFALRISRYSKKIMLARKKQKSKFDKIGFKNQVSLFHKFVVKSCRQFFVAVFNRRDIELTISDARGNKLDNEKARLIKKMISILIAGLRSISFKDTYEESSEKTIMPIELIHLFCKHGAYVCQSFLTVEELAGCAISETHGYLRMQKAMEKSQILSLVCIKILLFNAMLSPQKISPQPLEEESTLHENFYFIGSIWYELCYSLQDEYLAKTNLQNYDVGNWQKLREKFHIKPAHSLIYNNKAHQKGELVSGLMGEKKLRSIFGKDFWREQLLQLRDAVDHLHGEVGKFHQKLKSEVAL